MSLFDSAIAFDSAIPFWFVEIFKVLGFALHLLPVGLLLVGLPTSIILWLFGSMNCKRLAQRLFQQTPIFVAFAINLGIVPLLFIQLIFSKLFYTTSIIVAAHWLSILPFVFFSYVFSYLCAWAARKEYKFRAFSFACCSSLGFLIVGLIFTDIWSLFEKPYLLEEISSFLLLDFLEKFYPLGGSGAVSGLSYYWNDASIFIRYATLWGIACHTLGFWIVFDAYMLYRGPRELSEDETLALLEAEDQEGNSNGKRRKHRLPIREIPEKYKATAVSVSCVLILLGLLITTPVFLKFIQSDIDEIVSSVRYASWSQYFFWGVIGSFVLSFIFLVLGKLNWLSGRVLALGMAFCELWLVAFYSMLRHTFQLSRLAPYFDPTTQCISDNEFNLKVLSNNFLQWSPVLAFLFILIVVLIWVFILIWLMSLSGKKVETLANGSRGLKDSEKHAKEKNSKKKASKDF